MEKFLTKTKDYSNECGSYGEALIQNSLLKMELFFALIIKYLSAMQNEFFPLFGLVPISQRY